MTTFCAASLMNCLAGSVHMAGTVRTQRMSHSSKSYPCNFICSTACFLRYEIPCAKTSLAGNSFPPASAILVSLERFYEYKKRRFANETSFMMKYIFFFNYLKSTIYQQHSTSPNFGSNERHMVKTKRLCKGLN